MSDRLQNIKNQFSASSVTKGSCMCGAIEYEFKGTYCCSSLAVTVAGFLFFP